MLTSTRFDSADLDPVTEIFSEHHSRGAAPSVAWGIFDRRGLIRFGSIGEISDGRPSGPDSAYRIASCTKSFTAAAVLALRDSGDLNLDEPITRFVPAFPRMALPTQDAPTPTLRMLLTMSAGLPTDNPWADRQESTSADELDSLLRRGLCFDSVPGTRYAYSNLGFALLGRVIEQASGTPYRELVRELFIEPLALSGTGFDSSVPASQGVADGTRWLDGRWQTLPFSPPGVYSPIGGIFSTVTDLSRWAAWLAEAFDPSASFDTETPLSLASRREMQQLHRFAPNLSAHPTGYGFGLFVSQYPGDESVISHSGGYPGFSSHMRWSTATGFGIIAFGNATHSRVSAAATRAFDHLKASHQPLPTQVWIATRSAQDVVNALIVRWTDDAAKHLFADNVALDESFERRRGSIANVITEIGGLEPVRVSKKGDVPTSVSPDGPSITIGPDEESMGPAHLLWYLPGRAGRLRIEIELNPENPPRVQTLKVSSDRA